MAATKESLLGATRPVEGVEVPGVGEVLVRGLSAKDQEWFATNNERLRDDGLLQAHIVIRSVVDDDGELMFSEDDLPSVADLPGQVVDKIVGKANTLSGFDGDATGN